MTRLTCGFMALAAAVTLSLSAQQPPASARYYEAIRANDLPALRSLIAEAGPDARDASEQTPLMFAAAFGSPDAVEMLVAAGADAKAVSNTRVTPLLWATGDIRKVRTLLARGAEVNAVADGGRTPLIVAAASSDAGDVVALLIERGANVNAADAAGITPLIAAANADNRAAARLLLAKGADPHARANVPASATPLMGAALNNNLELARSLLARKVDVSVTSAPTGNVVKNGKVLLGNLTALHTATTSGSPEMAALLLDAGAAVDPRDARGMTPLMWSVATDHGSVRLTRLLLARGADPALRSAIGESAADWARKFNDRDVLPAFKLSHVPVSVTGTIAPGARATGTIRTAVERAMPLLRTGSGRMLTDGGCVACHGQPLTVAAADLARSRGWSVEPAAADAMVVGAFLDRSAATLLQAREGGGSPDNFLYQAIMLAEQKAPPGIRTDMLVHYLATKQRLDGRWYGSGATRAPLEDGDFSRTAMAIRTIAAYTMPARRTEFDQRVRKAAQWLAAQAPRSTEDRVMQLLGLTWAQAPLPASRVRELIAAQRPDGGWGQTPDLPTDAYATGTVLYALHHTGGKSAEAAIARGIAFLLGTQAQDGTWRVKNRAMKIQPYFESGFPYAHDQWISMAGTAWAVMGLSLAAPEAPKPLTLLTSTR